MPRACWTATSTASSTPICWREQQERSSRPSWACGRLARNSRPVRAQAPAPPKDPVSDVTLQTEENPAASLDEPQVQTGEAPLGGPGSMIVFESVTKVYEP